MAVTTQYNPSKPLNDRLVAAGASKTVYALVMPETERVKGLVLGRAPNNDATNWRQYLDNFYEAWTGKQDTIHVDFFTTWKKWSAPLVEINDTSFPFFYPTAGASEALRHLIAQYGNICRTINIQPRIHIFSGEYEGYKAFAEDCRIQVVEHNRGLWHKVAEQMTAGELFFLSQPSAIDGMVWDDCNEFLLSLSQKIGQPCVVLDVTYVGAIPEAPPQKIFMDQPCVANVVFSLSKPMGVYYDRIGGVFCREENLGLFGNKWFKNITSILLGTELMCQFGVFDLPRKYRSLQIQCASNVGQQLEISLKPCDVYLLAYGAANNDGDPALNDYLRRVDDGNLRICLTPLMFKTLKKNNEYEGGDNAQRGIAAN